MQNDLQADCTQSKNRERCGKDETIVRKHVQTWQPEELHETGDVQGPAEGQETKDDAEHIEAAVPTTAEGQWRKQQRGQQTGVGSSGALGEICLALWK